MSQENVEVVRRMLIAFRNGDWAAAAEPLDPDIERDTTRAPISGLDRVYNGLEEVAAFWREWLEAWGAQNYEDPELIDAGDQVVTWTTGHRIQGRAAESKSQSLRMRGWPLSATARLCAAPCTWTRR